MRFYVHSIQKHAADNALECDEFKQPYASFSHLWTRDIAGAVKDFLVEKAVPIEEETAAAAEGDAAPKEEGKSSSFGGALAPTPEPALADFESRSTCTAARPWTSARSRRRRRAAGSSSTRSR